MTQLGRDYESVPVLAPAAALFLTPHLPARGQSTEEGGAPAVQAVAGPAA